MIEETNRQFKCPCGKTYKSYPALHTHIRRKHEGEPPGDIQLPHNNLATRRGRPAVQMQKNHIVEERLQQLQALTLIQLGILRIAQLAKDYKTMLPGNQAQNLQYPKSHKYLFKQVPNSKILKSIRQFLEQFCQHFTNQLNDVMIRAYSLFFWYLEKESKGDFDVSVITRFLNEGWKQQATHRNLQYDLWYLNMVRQSFVVMSKWLYLKGFSDRVLTTGK